MKKFLAALALLVAIPAFAQENANNNVQKKPVQCFPAQVVIETLQQKYKEQPIFVLAQEATNETLIGMFVNPESGTYTIIEFNHEVACILATGGQFKLYPPKVPGIDI